MHDLNALIEKFWSNRISEAELERLDVNLKKLADQTPDAYFGENEFVFTDVSNPENSDSKKAKVLKSIHAMAHIAENEDVSPLEDSATDVHLVKWRWITGIAASLLLIFLSYPLLKMLSGDKLPKQHIVKNKKNSVFMKILDNKSDTVANVLLPDGSMSYVYPHSRIAYTVPFPANKRDITLLGAAKFKVAKDSLRPFTVLSHEVATTALGTYFKVEENKNGLEITLYEGKLKVHPIQDSSERKNAFLVTGQKLSVSNDFRYRKTTIEDIRYNLKQSIVPAVRKDAVMDSFQLDYHNTPLLNVFKNMELKYHKEFSYDNKTALDSLPFTGHLNENDSLEVLLKIICGMNNLQYEIQGRKVIISTK